MSTATTDAKKILQRSLYTKLPSMIPQGRITHTFMGWQELTPACTYYLSILKLVVHLLPVEIIRNENNHRDGIYIVGREEVVKYAKYLIEKVITSTEATVESRYYILLRCKKREEHGNTLRTKLRLSYINIWRKFLSGFEPFIDYTAEKKLFKEYISEFHLKAKRKIRGNKPI